MEHSDFTFDREISCEVDTNLFSDIGQEGGKDLLLMIFSVAD
jgi:hypothetical protein